MRPGELHPGMIVWANLSPVVGREQSGRRPAVVISSEAYLDVIDTLAIVVPLSKTDRGWPNHVKASGPTGLNIDSWIMTEQVRTISRDRISKVGGMVSASCLKEVRTWVGDFLGASLTVTG
jgi:mRNA interferase MazF